MRLVLGRVRPPRAAIARNLLLVGGGTVIGQGAVVVVAPLLARLYGPAAFGVLSLYSALLFVLLAVSSLRFDLAIPIARNETEALDLLVLSILVAVAASGIVAIVVLAESAWLAGVLGAPSIAPFLSLLPVALLVASIGQALSSWAVYHRWFTAVARIRAGQGVVLAICQAAFGVMQLGTVGLLAGDIVGRVAGVERVAARAWTAVRSGASSRRVLSVARDQARFSRVMTVASLFNALSLQVPFLLIPVLFDLRSSGQYYLAYRVLVLPAALVGAAVSQVFFGEASFRRDDPGRLRDLTRNSIVSLLVFAIPTYSLIAVHGPSLISVVFGSQWTEAGLFGQVMAPWLLVWSVASPVSTLLLVGRREHESLAFTVAELALKVASLLVGAAAHSLVVGVIALSCASLGISVVAVWRFTRVARVRLRDLARPAARIAGVTLPVIGVVTAIADRFPQATIVAAAAGWLCAVLIAGASSKETRSLLSGLND